MKLRIWNLGNLVIKIDNITAPCKHMRLLLYLLDFLFFAVAQRNNSNTNNGNKYSLQSSFRRVFGKLKYTVFIDLKVQHSFKKI